MLTRRLAAPILMSIALPLSTFAMAQTAPSAPQDTPSTAATATPAPVEGSWRLVSYEVEVKSGGETFPPMGDHPTGYVMFAP